MYYEYKIVDPASGKVYDFVTDPKLVYTAAYDAPSIAKFEENKKSDDSITFDYEYIDEDKLVVKAYISCNGEVAKEVSTKSGSTTIRNLELGKENYEFKFVVEYENGDLDKDVALKRLKTEALCNQILFHSEKSLKYIKYIGSEVVEG